MHLAAMEVNSDDLPRPLTGGGAVVVWNAEADAAALEVLSSCFTR